VGVPLTWPPAAINGVALTMPPDPWDSFPRGLWEAMPPSDRATLASVETTEGVRRAEGVIRMVRWMRDQQDSDLIAIGFRHLAGARRARGSRARTGATPGMPDGLDALLRLLISEIPARALLLVSPTHAATVRSHLHLNAWLEQQGLLRLSPSGTARRALRRLSRRDSSACRFLMEQCALPGELGQRRGVDGKRTAALADDAGVFLSCGGRSGAPVGSDASRAPLTDRAARARFIRDSIADLPAVGNVLIRENLSAGPGLIPLPDLVVEPADEGIATCPSLDASSVMGPAPEGEFHMIGGGVLALAGDCAGDGDAVPMRLTDIAPTVLHILGVPVPGHMEGTVATELFDDSWLRDHPVRVVASPDGLPRSAAQELSAVERQGVEAHLRALGYLG
jgi:hypothetical protein